MKQRLAFDHRPLCRAVASAVLWYRQVRKPVGEGAESIDAVRELYSSLDSYSQCLGIGGFANPSAGIEDPVEFDVIGNQLLCVEALGLHRAPHRQCQKHRQKWQLTAPAVCLHSQPHANFNRCNLQSIALQSAYV